MSEIYQSLRNRDLETLILVINSGSSSLKLTLFDGSLGRILDANMTHIKSDSAKLKLSSSEGEEQINYEKINGIQEGLEIIFGMLSEIQSLDLNHISLVGHRFVHGGPLFSSPVLLDDSIVEKLASLDELAPLHNSACLEGIRASRVYFGPDVKQIAVFDTAFYASMPTQASYYAIPIQLQEKHGIKRYGFHGISHSYLWNQYQQKIRQKSSESKIITLHLGNGCSITAIKDGKALDTSMGFTPAEGLVMATRAGDIDAGVVEYLCKKEGKTVEQILHLLNFESGLLGISNRSSKMEKLLDTYESDDLAKLAIEMFCTRAMKYLGAYLTLLGGADGIIFSGGIGEKSPEIRKRILNGLEWCDVNIDRTANEQAVDLHPGKHQKINTPSSAIPVYVIATDENYSIAESALNLSS